MTRIETHIRNNYRTQSIKGMAKDLKIPYDRVRKIMIANGWQSTHKRCTTIYQPAINKPTMFSWEDAMQQDFIFLNDQKDYSTCSQTTSQSLDYPSQKR
jgi:hypothetical protein